MLPRGWTLVGIIAGKAFFITWALVIPLLVYPWWVVLGAYVFFAMITSLIMATTFQLAHCVEEASFVSADELRAEPPDLGRPRGRDDRRLLPAEPRAHVDARRAQLPDRASPLPEGAAHALSEDRGDRASQLRQARRSLLVPPVARTCPPIALSSSEGYGSARSARPRSRWASSGPIRGRRSRPRACRGAYGDRTRSRTPR